MLLDKQQVLNIISALTSKTAATRLNWSVAPEGFEISLPQGLSVGVANNHGQSVYVQIFQNGAKIGEIVYSDLQDEVEREKIDALYTAARANVKDGLYQDIIQAIETAAEPVSSVTYPPLVTPPEITNQVFSRIAGKWKLDYSTGKELVEIKPDGLYLVNGLSEPKYQLKVIAYNPKTSAVEIAKDLPDGKRTGIEYLVLKENTMTGNVKHTGLELKYTKA